MMQTVALKPKRGEWVAMAVGLVALCAGMMIAPALCVPLALGIPLLGCPLIGQKEEAFAWVACGVPVAASLLAGYHALYAVSLALIGLLPMLVTKRIPLPKRPGARGMLLYVSTIAIALTLVLATATYALGGALWVTLPQAVVRVVGGLKNPSAALYYLANMGLVSVPEGYASQGVMRPFMQAAYNQQMLMSLRLTLEIMIEQLLPGLLVQASLIVGVFTPLRLERVNGVVLVVEARTASEKQTRVITPPSFRLLAMPTQLRWMAFAMLAASVVLILSDNPVAQVEGRLAFAVFQTLYRLLGAAIVVFLVTKNDPDHKTIAGVVAAALYVLLPQLLLMVGILDRPINFRKPQAHKPD